MLGLLGSDGFCQFLREVKKESEKRVGPIQDERGGKKPRLFPGVLLPAFTKQRARRASFERPVIVRADEGGINIVLPGAKTGLVLRDGAGRPIHQECATIHESCEKKEHPLLGWRTMNDEFSAASGGRKKKQMVNALRPHNLRTTFFSSQAATDHHPVQIRPQQMRGGIEFNPQIIR